MSQNPTIESVEEFLARGGQIQEIPRGVSGEWENRFNAPLKERNERLKKLTFEQRKKTSNVRDTGVSSASEPETQVEGPPNV